MKKIGRFTRLFFIVATTSVVLTAFDKQEPPHQPAYKFPYPEAGLTQQEAAIHLLNRFTYGPRQGEVDKILQTGLENWFAGQLAAEQPDQELNSMLAGYDALSMSNEEIVNTFPDVPKLLKMAVEDGVISKEEVTILRESDKKKYREQISAYLVKKGLKPKAELFRQLINQKILRAVYSNNQLQEVLTGFWFNHFNVSLTKNESSRFILAYERDAIRGHAFGKFENLLRATAMSPAMLTYLDNAKSRVQKEAATLRQMQQQQRMIQRLEMEQANNSQLQQVELAEKVKNANKQQGLNENYAREIMELHTLGVDGGYTQQDVREAARILTGWTVYPMEGLGRQAINKISSRFSEDQLKKQGFVHESDFLFAANNHDFGEKKFLGNEFKAGVGFEEGLRLIHLLSVHPSTANFICTKLATRFVNDEPPVSLVAKMAHTFMTQEGDIKAVLITMVSAPEFWSRSVTREKIKSPFELVVSAVRAVNASVTMPYQLYSWTAKMGEDLYHYQAPTGFPDRGRYWINTGSLLYRMNFGLALANNQVPGVKYQLTSLTNNHEPESAEAALEKFGAFLLPGCDMNETINRLLPLINDPEIQKKITVAASKTVVAETVKEDFEMNLGLGDPLNKPGTGTSHNRKTNKEASQEAMVDHRLLTQVVGILVGSPEFQRK